MFTSVALTLGLVVVIVAPAFSQANGEKRRVGAGGPKRDPKLLGLFEIVTFPNSPCRSETSTKNGTCYTGQECEDKGGENTGTCANGFGVCCTFTRNCGGTTSENCTYFESTGTEGASCSITVCKCQDDICQLRLDFDDFVINGPSTTTVTSLRIQNGLPTQTAVVAKRQEARFASRCLTDTFSVTSPGGTAPPVICGTNRRQHMYVDASESCNDLAFQFGSAAVGTTLVGRSWVIKISQYGCSYSNLAPSGCTQYFFGSGGTGTVQTYNFDGGFHLAEQNQVICVRREQGFCRICWSADASTDFMLSGTAGAINTGYMMGTQCCAYGPNGVGVMGYDCVVIPMPVKTKAGTPGTLISEYCGHLGLVTLPSSIAAATICSTRTPFKASFVSDSYEHVGESTTQVGFRLSYFQDATC